MLSKENNFISIPICIKKNNLKQLFYLKHSKFKLNQLFINRQTTFFYNLDMIQVELLQHPLHFAHLQSSVTNIQSLQRGFEGAQRNGFEHPLQSWWFRIPIASTSSESKRKVSSFVVRARYVDVWVKVKATCTEHNPVWVATSFNYVFQRGLR